MESRFSHLRQRDTSVSMLRVKMSRRRSQSQKENRERTVNTRRQLAKLQELEMSSLDASIAVANMSTILEKTQNKANPAKSKAVEERIKQLERWKERKALEKEKEKREKERKGVFKTGLYHPKDTIALVSLPAVPVASTRAKEKKVNVAPSQSTRVTRSMKQPPTVQKPLKIQDPNTVAKRVQPAVERSTRTRVASVKPAPTITKTKVCAVEPVVRALSTRSANRPPVPAAPVIKDKPADVRTTRSRANGKPVAPPSGGERTCKAVSNSGHPAVSEEPKPKEPEMEEPKKTPPNPTPCSEEEDMMVDQPPAESAPAADPIEAPSSLSSFAPEGYVFQAPAGLSSFKFDPLTPRSADAFLTPSSSFSLPPAPQFSDEPQTETSEPSPPKSPPRTSPPAAPPTPGSPLESKHDVPYFRSEIANETDRLTTLSLQWESKVEDESIPEEMRDRMRTAVGQARLLMKERFNQFSGLVDDCEFGRGEKITTCTDLQGFWDMVYYQVEDVNKKFDALKEAEGRGWVEEHKPPPRQRKVVKKPQTAPPKTTGTKAAAKSRLAAVKAAMKAKQQAAEAEKAAKDAANTEDNPILSSEEPQHQAGAQRLDTVVFDGGFFQVESPVKPSGSVRRSSRLSAAVLPQASPCSTYLSPRRVTRRSLALAQTPVHASPAQPVQTPAHLRLTLQETPASKSQRGTAQPSQSRKDTVNTSLCFSPVKEVLSDDTQPDGIPAEQSETLSTPEAPACVSEPSMPICLFPTTAVVEENDKPAEAADANIHNSPRLSLFPCKTPPPVSQAPEPSSALSFMLTPCVTPSQPPLSSPNIISSPAVQGPVETQQSVCHTPDSSVVEEIAGLDFERYLQPSLRGSLSPREMVDTETSSPMAVDVEMESPRGVTEDLLTQQEPALPAVSSMFSLQSPQVQTAESALLLFTPDLNDRIRQSVCPSELMVFTPPNM
ncbi:disks large-associated protein 5 isoform X2 [Amphiprion ocellaris]|uniref:disks large-associated protein 5 isoform X2 n=1 Tax=Amphiprion ocellaris TaxID=80972 RepID=UPI0024116881|nr:disks large-associated protein 5 isoform X2 [Amphiprion ocellaris]